MKLVTFLIFFPTVVISQFFEDFLIGSHSLRLELQRLGFAKEYVEGIFFDSRVEPHLDLIPKVQKKVGCPDQKSFDWLLRAPQRGQIIIKNNWQFLEKIERRYGVEKEVLVAIYGIETVFGTSLGQRLIFNTLLTLAAVENRRTVEYRNQFVNWLFYCQIHGLDPLAIQGSWLGAFGLTQFRPDSALKFAVDGNGDGKVDLFCFEDAIASTANYLAKKGWLRGDSDRSHKYKVLLTYNSCGSYARAVLAYAEAIKQRSGLYRSEQAAFLFLKKIDAPSVFTERGIEVFKRPGGY